MKNLHCYDGYEEMPLGKSRYFLALKESVKYERKILKVFLLTHLHKLLCELFRSKIQENQYNFLMEYYLMDGKIVQYLIHDIVETGEYTLKGIAHSTRIPYDVILDASCGNNNQLSITPWARIVDLYLQVKPDMEQLLFDKLLDLKKKNDSTMSLLLSES